MFSKTFSAIRPFGVLLIVAVVTFGAVESSRCHAQQRGTFSVAVTPLDENPLGVQFTAYDADGNGVLTEAEYLKRAGREKSVSLREFKVFDIDGDGRMTLAEFVTVPDGQPDELRGVLADPVVVLSEKSMARLTKQWKEWDRNGDDLLAPDEFKTAAIPAIVPGLESTGFADWDLDHDGQVSREEAAGVLDVAFGVRVPSGERLRDNIGRVVVKIVGLVSFDARLKIAPIGNLVSGSKYS